MSLVLALAMCVSAFGVSAFAANYDDYADADTVADYAENETAIDVVTGLKIIEGDENGYLNLDEGLTRAEAAKILTVVDLGTKTAASVNSSTVNTGYSDTKGHWASGYIAYCTNKNFLAGTGSGKFEPDAPLTGYAFGKMMLNVLGYGLEEKDVQGTDTLINDYTGDLWEIKVLVDGTEIGLFKDVDCDLAGPICRADAMQMVFNALANAVSAGEPYSYKLTDGTIVKYPEGRDSASWNNDYYDVAPEFEIRFTEGAPGAYKRPTTTIYVDGKGGNVASYDKDKDVTLTSYTNKLVETFTSKVSEGDVFDAIGAEGIQGSSAKYIVMDEIYEDGVLKAESQVCKDSDNKEIPGQYEATSDSTAGIKESVIISKGGRDNAAGFGNGVTVEIYETREPNRYIMVAYREYIGTVKSVSKADENTGKKRTVTIERTTDLTQTPATAEQVTFESETLNKNDVVLYTVDNNKVATAVPATETVTGAISKKTSDGVYTIGGEGYELSQTVATGFAADLAISNTDRTFYTDSFGYIIAEKNPMLAMLNYGFVTEYACKNGMPANNMTNTPASAPYEKIKMVTSEGKEVIFDTAFTVEADGLTIYKYNSDSTKLVDHRVGKELAALNTDNTLGALDGRLVSYTLDSEGKIATLNVAPAANSAGLSGQHTKGTTFPVVSGGQTLANDKTVIFVKESGKTTAEFVRVYVGYANVPDGNYTALRAIDAQGPNAGAMVVQVASLTPETNDSTVYFASAVYTESKNAMGQTIYTYDDAYVDGVKVEGGLVTSNNIAVKGAVFALSTDVNTGIATIGAQKSDTDVAINASASGYFTTKTGTPPSETITTYYVDTKTVYYQITKDGVEKAAGLPALNPDVTVKLVATDITGSTTTPAKYVYFTVAE